MSHAMGGRPGRPRPTRDTYQPFLVKLKLKLQCYHFCLYGGLRRYNPERLMSHGHGHGRASGTPTPCSRRTPTAFGKAQLSTAPTWHRIPGWSAEVTCLAYLRVRVLCQPTLWPLGMAVSSHIPTTCRLSLSLLALLISSLSFILASIPHCLHFSLLPLLIIFHLLSFPLFCPVITSLTHHLAFPFILVFILPQIYSLISFPLPTYLLYSTCPYIFQKLLTYFISSTHLYIFSLTYLVLILFCISYPTLLPLLMSPLSRSLSHQNITYPYIHNPTKSFIITQNITPKPFHFLFIILHSLFIIKTWSFTALFHILLNSTHLYYHFHYSLFTILNYYTLLYYHFHYYPPFLYLILYYYSYIFTFNLPMGCDKIHYLIQFKYSFSSTSRDNS